MSREMDSCVQPAAGPLVPMSVPDEEVVSNKENDFMVAKVGKKAPDFEASAYVAGQGFKNVRLSDYEGKWVVICFYPGDFTFV